MKTSFVILPSCLAAAALLTSCVDTYSTSPAVGYRTGNELRDLPRGARVETVSGTRYYNHNGTYYRPSNGRYVIVESPRGRNVVVESPRGRNRDRVVYVERLPSGYHMKRYSGRNYYVVGQTYYRQRGSGYVVVDRPF
ncbi:MAG: DUF6515 family protein [Verrucomicrobiota bacterium]